MELYHGSPELPPQLPQFAGNSPSISGQFWWEKVSDHSFISVSLIHAVLGYPVGCDDFDNFVRLTRDNFKIEF